MPYIKVDSRIARVEIKTTGKIRKILEEISKHDHRTMTNEIENLILNRAEEIKKQQQKFEE